MLNSILTVSYMYKLYDSKGGYIGSFLSWKQADNYRFARGNKYWTIKS